MEGSVQSQPCYSTSSLMRGDKVKGREAEPVIIGGMVLDIHATPSMPTNPKTTTPGKVLYTLGGVARNVAECVSKLGTKPFLISAVGLDMSGKLLLGHWESAGLSTEGILRHHEIDTAAVCNVFDLEGEVAVGVASVEAIEKFLIPEWIQQFKNNVRCAPVVMVDANISSQALEASCRMVAESGVPVWFEPVSVVKSRRVASVVKHLTFASPNEGELIAMANAVSSGEAFSPIQRDSSSGKHSTEYLFQMLKPAIWVLLEKGIEVLVVTLGPHGVLLCSEGHPDISERSRGGIRPHGFAKELYEAIQFGCPPNRFCSASIPKPKGSSNHFVVHFPALPTSVVRLTGAGDCLVGGMLASICVGLDIMQSVAVGIATAKAAVEAETNVPAGYCLKKLADDAKTVYFGAKVVFCQSML